MNEQERKAQFKTTFNTVANSYDNPALRFFPESARHLASYLGLGGDEHVLDVATGTGNAAFALARDLPRGHVTGIDFSEGMLSQAKKKMTEQNIRNISFMEMDMQAIAFPDNHFDAVVSAFGIFFCEEMEKQLAYISTKVKNNGKVIITNFHDNAFSPLQDIFMNRLRQYKIDVPPISWKRISTGEKCAALFDSSGLKDIRHHQKDCGYYLRDAGQWWDIIWNAGFRRLVSQLSPENLEEFRKEHLAEIEKLSTAEGIRLEMNILYTVGTK